MAVNFISLKVSDKKENLEQILLRVELIEAVPGRDDPLRSNNRSAANESPVTVQRHDERPRFRTGLRTTDDSHFGALITLIVGFDVFRFLCSRIPNVSGSRCRR